MFDRDIKRVIIGVADDIEQDKNAWTPSWRPGYGEASINISLIVDYIARTTGQVWIAVVMVSFMIVVWFHF